jgi:mono/diheme cytochrome c family protein
MSTHEKKAVQKQQQVYGVLAEFEAVDPLMHAAQVVRDAGYTQWDAHTPFPVHGLDKAMGVKMTRLPWMVLVAGVTGLITALVLQYWTNAVNYPFRISGKPLFGVPANIPVTFELTVLFSAFTVFFGTLALNKLPELFHPLFDVAKFRRATNDRFFIFIDAKDRLFNEAQTTALLQGCHPVSLETLSREVDEKAFRLPRWMPATALVLTVLTLVPLVLIAKAREEVTTKPRVHLIPDDMDQQYKFKAQQKNGFFEDGRAMRMHPEGTVAMEDSDPSLPQAVGKDAAGMWLNKAPVVVNQGALERGRERYGVYCAPCHGLSGYGDGMVARRAEQLQEGTWVPPSSFHTDNVRSQAVGQLFNSITLGVRNMPSYGSQIPEEDRWLIALYVKALQRSQKADVKSVPGDVLPSVE